MTPRKTSGLAAAQLAKNRQAGEMFREKGFGIRRDEPGGVQINRYLVLGEDEA